MDRRTLRQVGVFLRELDRAAVDPSVRAEVRASLKTAEDLGEWLKAADRKVFAAEEYTATHGAHNERESGGTQQHDARMGTLYAARTLLTVDQVADRLNVSRRFVYSHAEALGAVRLNDAPNAPLRFEPVAIDQWLGSRRLASA